MDFLNNEPGSFILLDSLDFLIESNAFRSVVKVVQKLRDLSVVKRSILVIQVASEPLKKAHMRMLMREVDKKI